MDSLYQFLRIYTKFGYRLRGTGFGRICEAIRKTVARYSDGKIVLIEDFMGSLRFYCNLSDHIGSQVFWKGAYSSDQLAILARHLYADAVFVDVGAHQGEFTVFAASLVGESGKVIAFEPVSRNRDLLCKNVTANSFSNVTILPFALGVNEGIMPIYDRSGKFDDGTNHTGLSTLFPSRQRDHLIEYVHVKNLDDVVKDLNLAKIDFMKIDVEGSELAVLQGAIGVLQTSRPKLVFELNQATCQAAGYTSQDLLAWLQTFGYNFAIIAENGVAHTIEEPSHIPEFCNVFASTDSRHD